MGEGDTRTGVTPHSPKNLKGLQRGKEAALSLWRRQAWGGPKDQGWGYRRTCV